LCAEESVDGATMRRWDRNRIQFLFTKPALDADINVVSALAINLECHAMICEWKNGGVNRVSAGTRLL